MALLLKRRHNMMTLHLRRCVSLFVCLFLLISACSPDKSHKTNSKVNEFNRITKVDKDSVEKIAHHAPSAVNNNNVHPVGFWNREIGKVGGVSITPKRVAIGTVAVLGTATVLYIGYKRCKRLTQQPLTVPPAGSSSDPSAEETNALNEANTIRREIQKIDCKEGGRREDGIEYKEFDKVLDDQMKQNIDICSNKATHMFGVVAKEINDKSETALPTPEIVKTAIESAEDNFMENNYYGYSKDRWRHILTTYARIAEEGKTKPSQNMINKNKKHVSAEVMAVRLATLRKIGAIWDNEGIRQNLNERKLKINEGVALNTIMATLEERLLNYATVASIYNIKKQLIPNDLNVILF
jgi:hypothetical protein